jgi:diguanylate cyclase (GGDEF)-like protein
MSPFFYIIVSLLFTNVILAIIFFSAYFTMGKERHTLIWAVTFIIGVFQWLVNIFKPGDFTVYWMLACSLSVGTVLFGTWGHLVRTKSKFSEKSLLTSGVLIILVTYYFTAIAPHRGLSMSLYIFHTVFYLCVCGVVLLKHRKRPRPAEIGAASVYFLFAITQGVAATFVLLQGSETNQYYFDIYRTINFVSLPTGYIGMSLFIVFVLASDMSEKMRVQSITDQLTDCLNRRGFYQYAQKKLKELINTNQHVCLIYWDIDKFKAVNDTYGHAAGDQVLCQTTNVVKSNIKSTDLIGRLGGEEFVILLGRASFEEAQQVAERLRASIESNAITYKDLTIEVTASFGVMNISDAKFAIENAIDRADKALYQAKQGGRNRVVEAGL